MSKDIIKIGPKQKYLEIPDGWEIVQEGVCQANDKFANLLYYKWTYVEKDDIGMSTDFFECLIRKTN